MWFVKYLELENFSCFDKEDQARFNFGNFQDLQAVLHVPVEQNGGTCNGNSLMNAVAFVLGLDWTSASNCDGALGMTAGVSLVCNYIDVVTAGRRDRAAGENSTEKKFTRKISDDSSAAYQIDGKSVSKKIYLGELQFLGLEAEDKYCLVMEGACVALFTKSRKQQTQILFEVMARAESLSLKEQYEHLQAAIRSKDRELRQLLRVKKHKYYMFKLFHWEQEKLELEKSVEQVTQLNRKLKEDVDGKRSECRIRTIELKKTEKEFLKMELNVRNLSDNHVATLTCLKWGEEMTNLAREDFEKAETAFFKHKLKTDELEKRIEVFEAHLLEIKSETSSEYDDLKVEAERRMGGFFQSFKELQSKKIKIQLELDSVNSQLKDFRTKLTRTEDEFERRRRRTDENDHLEKTSVDASKQVKREASQKRKRLEKVLSPNKRLFTKNNFNKRAVDEMKRNIEIMNTEANKVLTKTSIQHSEFTQFITRLNDFEEKAFHSTLQTIKKEENYGAHFIDLIKFFRDKIQENETLIESWREKMNEINGEIAEVEKRMNSIENQVFKDFCQSVGACNIKEYRTDKMLGDNLQSAKKIEIRNEINQLKSRIDYENGTNLKYEEMKLAKELVDLRENDLKVATSKESRQREELNKRVEEYEEVRKSRSIIKAEITNLECKIYELKSKSLNLEARKELDQLHIRKIVIKRHQLLIKCKEQKIEMFFESGDWSDVSFYDTNEVSIYVKEAQIKFDFSSLEPNLKKGHVIENKNLPNGDVDFQQFESIAEKVESGWITFEDARKKMKNLKLELNEVKSQRFLQFMQMFKHVNSCVDTIYKELTKCRNARATLTLENVTKPYLDGVKYEFVGKKNATGEMGDRYVAAMALLMSTQTFRSPSVEKNGTTLDQENIEKMANFIEARRN